MPSTYLIAIAIAALLIILIAYALIAQHTAKKRKQRQRLAIALKQRQLLFTGFVEGFPAGFLTPELQTLVFQVLLSISEQLHQLEPRGGHKTGINLYTNALSQKASPSPQPVKFETPEQTQKIRGLLQELGRYITAQTEQNRIAKPQAHSFINQIKTLFFQVTFDDALREAKKAEADGKPPLALHRYKQCLSLLQKNQQNTAMTAQITEIVDRLTAEIDAAKAVPEKDDAWKEIEADDEWKKKQLYD